MRKLFLLAIMLMAGFSLSYSQVETLYLNKGEAAKLINIPIRSKGVIKVMPSFDLAQLEKEDAVRDSTVGMIRFGKHFDVSYTLADGVWENVDGGRMWTMTFKSEGALSLNFIFNDFHLPDGAELYIINKDESVLFGPVTKESTTENGVFLTDIIKGDQASIYLFEPFGCEGLSSLTIKRVVHGYRNFEATKGTNRDYVYTQDVACYPDYEMASDAVAMILQGCGYCIGTGFLIMSVDYSFKPYFLTSYYAVSTDGNSSISEGEIYDAENSMFKFRYKKTTCEGTNIAATFTYNQAKLRASWDRTLFALFELKGAIKQNLALSWLGWDISHGSSEVPACIHHPLNNVMKISFAHSPLYYNSSYSWGSWFMDNGSIYSYSIGAPLLNETKRVIGHISNTFIPLNNYCESNYAYIGQFQDSWNGGGTNTTRLSNWLDPDNTGLWYMDSHRSLGNLEIIGDSVIYMNAPNEYYVSNLPNGMDVTWSITDTYYQGDLDQGDNLCTIYGNTGHEILNATLTASVYNNGTLVQTASKTVSTEEVFHGTYYNGQTTKPIGLPYPLYVLSGTQVYITSPNLVGASAYYDGNVTPYIWSFDSSNGILYVGMPSSPSGTAVINVHVTTALGNSFTLPIVRASTVYSMSVGVNLGQMTISLVEDEKDADESSLSDDNRLPSEKTVSWNLEVTNVTTGKKVFSQEIEGSSFILDTRGLEPGIYIVMATIGDEVLSEKVIVK